MRISVHNFKNTEFLCTSVSMNRLGYYVFDIGYITSVHLTEKVKREEIVESNHVIHTSSGEVKYEITNEDEFNYSPYDCNLNVFSENTLFCSDLIDKKRSCAEEKLVVLDMFKLGRMSGLQLEKLRRFLAVDLQSRGLKELQTAYYCERHGVPMIGTYSLVREAPKSCLKLDKWGQKNILNNIISSIDKCNSM